MAVVGTRRASRYGLEAAFWLARELAQSGITIVSGLAKGIDGAAHRGALAAGGRTVAVMGCGLDICYPARHRDLFDADSGVRDSGLGVRARHPADALPLPGAQPDHRRDDAGGGAGRGVGGRGCNDHRPAGPEFGREVFAVPGAVHSPVSVGPHLMVRDGARLAGVGGPDPRRPWDAAQPPGGPAAARNFAPTRLGCWRCWRPSRCCWT